MRACLSDIVSIAPIQLIHTCSLEQLKHSGVRTRSETVIVCPSDPTEFLDADPNTDQDTVYWTQAVKAEGLFQIFILLPQEKADFTLTICYWYLSFK
jgi:hypothetical protein